MMTCYTVNNELAKFIVLLRHPIVSDNAQLQYFIHVQFYLFNYFVTTQ